MLDERRIALPRPTQVRVEPAPATLEEKLEALREELHDTRMRLAAAERRADEAYWNQLAAEERSAEAREAARDQTTRTERLEAELNTDEAGRLRTELELVQQAAAQMEMELQRSLAELAARS